MGRKLTTNKRMVFRMFVQCVIPPCAKRKHYPPSPISIFIACLDMGIQSPGTMDREQFICFGHHRMAKLVSSVVLRPRNPFMGNQKVKSWAWTTLYNTYGMVAKLLVFAPG